MIVALTFTICLGAQCVPGSQYWRATGIGEARACRMAYDFARARAHPDAVFRDVECKPMEGKMSEEQEPWSRPLPELRIEAEQAAKQARAELRDRFAEKAMEKMIEAADIPASKYHDENNRNALAKPSYGIADAMLKARDDEGKDKQ